MSVEMVTWFPLELAVKLTEN